MIRPDVRAALVVSASGAGHPLEGALAARGFAVFTAGGAEDALRCLSDEIDGFDLLVVYVEGTRDDGDVLVRTVRRGGESDLAVVAITGAAQPAAELERAGADAVLDRSLGVELIARASEAVLSRKRGRRRG